MTSPFECHVIVIQIERNIISLGVYRLIMKFIITSPFECHVTVIQDTWTFCCPRSSLVKFGILESTVDDVYDEIHSYNYFPKTAADVMSRSTESFLFGLSNLSLTKQADTTEE